MRCLHSQFCLDLACITRIKAKQGLFPSMKHYSFNQSLCKELSKKRFEIISMEEGPTNWHNHIANKLLAFTHPTQLVSVSANQVLR